MFQLQITDTDVTNGTIAVSWCLDHELVQNLAMKGVTDPQVVICISPTGNSYNITKEYRKVVPLKDLMSFVEFRASGSNKIWGLVSYKNKREARDFYLSKSNGEFKSNILSPDGDDYSGWLISSNHATTSSSGYLDLSQPISVNVPEGVFAEEPAQWEKTWVNHFFRDKVIDQCEFRRRRFFAYGVQPFIFLANILFRLLLTILAGSLLLKSFSTKYIFHPIMYSLMDTFKLFSKGPLFMFHLPEDDDNSYDIPKPWYFIRKLCLFPLIPFVWLPITLFCLFGKWNGAIIVTSLFLLLFMIILGAAFVANFSFDFKSLLTSIVDKFNSWYRNDKLWYLDQDELNLITCNSDKPVRNYANLPSKHKTINLRFQNLKSKVCRPFSL